MVVAQNGRGLVCKPHRQQMRSRSARPTRSAGPVREVRAPALHLSIVGTQPQRLRLVSQNACSSELPPASMSLSGTALLQHLPESPVSPVSSRELSSPSMDSVASDEWSAWEGSRSRISVGGECCSPIHGRLGRGGERGRIAMSGGGGGRGGAHRVSVDEEDSEDELSLVLDDSTADPALAAEAARAKLEQARQRVGSLQTKLHSERAASAALRREKADESIRLRAVRVEARLDRLAALEQLQSMALEQAPGATPC